MAIGAAVGSNCEPCFKFHYDKARKLGVAHDDMVAAVRLAQQVKDTPATAMLDLAGKLLAVEPAAFGSLLGTSSPAEADSGGSCCGGGAETGCCG